VFPRGQPLGRARQTAAIIAEVAGLGEPRIRRLDKPQGVIFRLADGRVELLEPAPLPSAAAAQ